MLSVGTILTMKDKAPKKTKKVGAAPKASLEIYIRIGHTYGEDKDTIAHAASSVEEAVAFINKHAK